MVDPVYVKISDIFDLIAGGFNVFIVYRPIPGIGDAVMISPALTAIRKQIDKNDILVMICVDYISGIIEHNNAVDFIVKYSSEEVGDGKDLLDLKLLEDMNCIVYRLQHPCPCAEHECSTPKPERRSRQELYSEACDVKFHTDNYNLKLHTDELDAPREFGLPDRYITIQLKSSETWKDYRYMKRLVKELTSIGSKNDFGVVTLDAEIDYKVPQSFAVTDTPLRKIYGIIHESIFTIGLCSGFTHVAGAFGLPVFGLYGPTPPGRFLRYKRAEWLPRFERCKKQYCWYEPCRLKPCLSINPKKVIARIVGAMKKYGVVDVKA